MFITLQASFADIEYQFFRTTEDYILNDGVLPQNAVRNKQNNIFTGDDRM